MFFSERINLRMVLVVLLILLVAIFSLRSLGNSVKGFLLDLMSPFLKFFRLMAIGTRDFFDFLGSIGDLKKENARLTKENLELEGENVRYEDVEAENQTLRDELGLEKREDLSLEAVFVIGEDPHVPGDFIFIDKGTSRGIETDMPVIASSNVMIGKVSEVYPESAKVRLLFDPQSGVNVEAEKSKARGIAKGKYGIGIMLDMVSQIEVLNEGDRVFTSGLGGGAPRGLFVGKIGVISQSEDKLFQTASILAPIRIRSLRVAYVITKY